MICVALCDVKIWLKWSVFSPIFWSDFGLFWSQDSLIPRELTASNSSFTIFSVGSSQPTCIDCICWNQISPVKPDLFPTIFHDFLRNKPIPIIPRASTGSENRWNGPKKGVFPWDWWWKNLCFRKNMRENCRKLRYMLKPKGMPNQPLENNQEMW